MMRLIEVIEGDETSEETMQAAAGFAQALRKTPVRCGEVPGFVVNRILTSAMSEVWKATEDGDLSVEEVDKAITDAGATPMGPYFLSDLLGLDTVLHVAEHLHESYGGERFHVSARMKELVLAGDLGQKTGKGFYEHG
jgi:3-hydroxyacyl-CoA dehydrogenase